MTGRERIEATLCGEQVDQVAFTPITMAWAARQIGRCYRDYYLDHRVLVEAQLVVARLVPVDQVSTISDPFRESTAFGAQFDWPENGVGIPRHPLPLESGDRLEPFDPYACERTRDRIDAVAALARAVGSTHSVLGWVEGPLAEYADLRGLDQALLDLMDEPQRFERVADVLISSAVRFAQAQIDAGADMIGVGDAACSLIGPDVYQQYIHPLQCELFKQIHDAGARVKLHICGNTSHLLPLLATTGADVIDIDWMVPLSAARQAVGKGIVLAGNLDPVNGLMQSDPESISRATADCIRDAGPRFLLQPGCEIPVATPIEHVHALAAAARPSVPAGA